MYQSSLTMYTNKITANKLKPNTPLVKLLRCIMKQLKQLIHETDPKHTLTLTKPKFTKLNNN